MTQFDFYLLNLSFRAPDGLQLHDLKNSIEQLSEDCAFIRQQEEKIHRHPSIYEEYLWADYQVLDILYNPASSDTLGRDHCYMLQTIIDHAAETATENDRILAMLDAHGENQVNGLLCLHTVPEVDSRYCVYDRNDWLAFHRYFLGHYPVSNVWFTAGCRKYFPKLCFHAQIHTSLNTLPAKGIHSFSHTIVDALTCLNDYFDYCRIPNNIPETLERFKARSGFETSNEGNSRRKDDLSFSFVNQKGLPELVYCEPHLKISRSDQPGDHFFYQNRIYFSPGKENIEGGKILVGHIGGHL